MHGNSFFQNSNIAGTALERKERRYTVRPFGMNSLKE
jgi:hypothetical protein